MPIHRRRPRWSRARAAHGLSLFTVGREGRGAQARLQSCATASASGSSSTDRRGRHEIYLPLVGDFQASNALVAAGLVIATGGEEALAMHALESLKGAQGPARSRGARRQRARRSSSTTPIRPMRWRTRIAGAQALCEGASSPSCSARRRPRQGQAAADGRGRGEARRHRLCHRRQSAQRRMPAAIRARDHGGLPRRHRDRRPRRAPSAPPSMRSRKATSCWSPARAMRPGQIDRQARCCRSAIMMRSRAAVAGRGLSWLTRRCGPSTNWWRRPAARLRGDAAQAAQRCFDRQPHVAAGDIFVAIKGERIDGHDFAAQALKAGAGLAIVSRPTMRWSGGRAAHRRRSARRRSRDLGRAARARSARADRRRHRQRRQDQHQGNAARLRCRHRARPMPRPPPSTITGACR